MSTRKWNTHPLTPDSPVRVILAARAHPTCELSRLLCHSPSILPSRENSQERGRREALGQGSHQKSIDVAHCDFLRWAERGYSGVSTVKIGQALPFVICMRSPGKVLIASSVILDGSHCAITGLPLCHLPVFLQLLLGTEDISWYNSQERFTIPKWDTPYFLLSSSSSFSNIAQEISVTAAIAISLMISQHCDITRNILFYFLHAATTTSHALCFTSCCDTSKGNCPGSRCQNYTVYPTWASTAVEMMPMELALRANGRFLETLIMFKSLYNFRKSVLSLPLLGAKGN